MVKSSKLVFNETKCLVSEWCIKYKHKHHRCVLSVQKGRTIITNVWQEIWRLRILVHIDIVATCLLHSYMYMHVFGEAVRIFSDPCCRSKIKFLFSGATFHIPLTKSATLNRLLHCSLLQFSGALFYFRGLFFLHFGGEIFRSRCVFFPALARFSLVLVGVAKTMLMWLCITKLSVSLHAELWPYLRLFCTTHHTISWDIT